MTRSKLERKGFIQLTVQIAVYHQTPLVDWTGMQAGQEAGVDAEVMEGCFLLACFHWLAQTTLL